MECLPILNLEYVVIILDLFVTTIRNMDIITVDHLRKMKKNVIVCIIVHFDNEIDMQGLENLPRAKKINIKPQNNRWVFPDNGSDIIFLTKDVWWTWVVQLATQVFSCFSPLQRK